MRERSSERQRRQERLLTSGYEACRYSAGGVGVRGRGVGGGGCLLAKMFFLKYNVSTLWSVNMHVGMPASVCNLPGQIPL